MASRSVVCVQSVIKTEASEVPTRASTPRVTWNAATPTPAATKLTTTASRIQLRDELRRFRSGSVID